MKKVAIMTKDFMSWNGGIDFIKHIILALDKVVKKDELEIYVFISELSGYKKYSGLKRLYYKLKYKYFLPLIISDNNELFSECKNCKFVQYSENNLEKILEKLKIDLFFPHMSPKLFASKVKSVGYLYDCQHKYYPHFFTKEDCKARDDLFQRSVDGGLGIVNAKAVKDDLVKFYSAKPENVLVLPFTPKLNLDYLKDNSKLIEKYKLPQKYFIISNQFWLHKDHVTAFKAFAEFIKDEEFRDVELICTGAMREPRNLEHIDNLRKLIVDLGCEKKIRCLGLIPKIEQIEIMKGAVAVIQPTLFEGGAGGGSVQDAIALGVPSIVSDISVNLEIECNYVEFFKAGNVDDLILKMANQIWKDKPVFSVDNLVRKSEKNIKKLGCFLLDIIYK